MGMIAYGLAGDMPVIPISKTEAAEMNISLGYIVALISQLVIFPFFGIRVTLSDNLWIGLWFTVISIIRSYTLRRIFNRIRS